MKAVGLAAGKGVVVASTREEAYDAVHELKNNFGSASERIIVEEKLAGEEISVGLPLRFRFGTIFLPSTWLTFTLAPKNHPRPPRFFQSVQYILLKKSKIHVIGPVC